MAMYVYALALWWRSLKPTLLLILRYTTPSCLGGLNKEEKGKHDTEGCAREDFDRLYKEALGKGTGRMRKDSVEARELVTQMVATCVGLSTHGKKKKDTHENSQPDYVADLIRGKFDTTDDL